jgi:hypothetical protein
MEFFFLWLTLIRNLSFTHLNFLWIKSALLVVELCYYGEQVCVDNAGGTDVRVSARMRNHKQEQLNFDQVNLFVLVPWLQLNTNNNTLVFMRYSVPILACYQLFHCHYMKLDVDMGLVDYSFLVGSKGPQLNSLIMWKFSYWPVKKYVYS